MARPGLTVSQFLMATAAVFAGGAAAARLCPVRRADQDRRHRRGAVDRGRRDPGSGAQIAADEINAKGGINGRKIEIVVYDNKSSSADSVRAFQRAVSRRQGQRRDRQLHQRGGAGAGAMGGAAAHAVDHARSRQRTRSPRPIHNDYDKNKYTFHGYLTSAAQAQAVCDAAKDLLVDGMKMKTAVVMSEDAAWTKPLDEGYLACLPQGRTEGRRPHPLLAGHHRLHADLQQARRQEAGRDRDRHLACRRAADRAMEEPAGADPDVRHQRAGAEPDLLGRHQRRGRRHSIAGGCDRQRRGDAEDEAVRRGIQDQVRDATRPIPAIPPMTRFTSSPRPSSAPVRPIRTRWSRRLEKTELRRHDRPCRSSTAARTSSPTASNTVRTIVSGMVFQWQDGKQVTLWPAKNSPRAS